MISAFTPSQVVRSYPAGEAARRHDDVVRALQGDNSVLPSIRVVNPLGRSCATCLARAQRQARTISTSIRGEQRRLGEPQRGHRADVTSADHRLAFRPGKKIHRGVAPDIADRICDGTGAPRR